MTQSGFCFNHRGARAIAICIGCSASLCGVCSRFADDGARCERCAQAHEDSQLVRARSEQLSEPAPGVTSAVTAPAATDLPGQPSAILNWLPWIGLVLVLGGVGTSLYFYANPQIVVPESPTREREETATALIRCLQVFRQIGEQMAAGQEPDMRMQCDPPSGPNLLERDEDTIRVSHADPQLFGLQTLYVSNSDPEPVVE